MPNRLHACRLAACLLAPTLALGLSSAARAASLVKVGDAGKVAVYVDKDSLRRNGAQVRSAVEWRWAQPTEVRDSSPTRMYRLERQVLIANCENRSYAIAEGTQYSDERGIDVVNSYKHDELAVPYSVAPSRTILDTVVTWVCSAAPAAKKP